MTFLITPFLLLFTINGHALCKHLFPADAFVQLVLIPQTSFNQLCCFPPSSPTQLFPGCTLAFICLLLCWQKGTFCPHIYKSSFMCLQQVEICCHMNLWHRAVRKAGKVNKEDLRYHKPWYLKSIHQKLPASFAINHFSDSSQWGWVGGKGSATGKSCSCEEGLRYLLPASFLSC